jgi:sucrose-6-phosphate hydrolase SacC (GH32 family)
MRIACLSGIIISVFGFTALVPAQSTVLFQNGTFGYQAFLTPSLITTNHGTVLAFCQGRKRASMDNGDADLLVRRSLDSGATWTLAQIVWDDKKNTCGNPCSVLDVQSGTVWLLMTWSSGNEKESTIPDRAGTNSRRVYVTFSQDDGGTWALPRDITQDVTSPDWTWYATGPGAGVQLSHGRHKGRLMIPCQHAMAEPKERSFHIIYSDDNGKTWAYKNMPDQAPAGDSSLTVLPDGRPACLYESNENNSPENITFSILASDDIKKPEPDSTMLVLDPAVTEAMVSLRDAIPKAAQDPERPMFHFRAPALWMNDPNGPLFHDGFYHVFYQFNPYGETWGHMHWGHARSRDLVYWSDLPVALWPSKDKGEEHCFSGCARINAQGRPMVFYTSVAGQAGVPNQQWAALGDKRLFAWTKFAGNPVLDLKMSGVPPFTGAWRDPFIFKEQGRIFMILGADTQEKAMIPLFEAQNGNLDKWIYRGILYESEKKKVDFFECPNIVKLADKWVLMYSPYRAVEYIVGHLDMNEYRFIPETRGVVDPGQVKDNGFYASNILLDPHGRTILLGWLRGFPQGQGWNGCMALPRQISLDNTGHLIQEPVPELQKLRRHSSEFPSFVLNDESRDFVEIQGDMLELSVEMEPVQAVSFGVELRCSLDDTRSVPIRYDGRSITVAGAQVPLELAKRQPLKLHIFLDHSVLEVFVNDGSLCLSRVISSLPSDNGVRIYCIGGSVIVKNMHMWEMDSIW